MRPVTVITGASAGIGLELAREFARHGHALVLVARREGRLRELAAEIAAMGAPEPVVLPIDLALPNAVAWIGNALAMRKIEPEYVVNNAAFGLVGHAAALDRGEQLAMIDLNMRTLTDLSLAFVESLARHRGGLLNVGSVAGLLPGPGGAVYYASKAYVVSLTEALHSELRPRGIRVTCLCPGPVPTEFQARAGVPGDVPPPPFAQSPARVARVGYRALMQGRRMVVPGLAMQIVAALAPRVAPRSLLLAALDHRASQRAGKVGIESAT
jgi:short-subunit dehydrogenase